MTLGKPVLLLAGLAGILSVVLPLCSLSSSSGPVSVSVLDVFLADARDDVDLGKAGFALIVVFAPGLLITLLALLGLVRRFGRGIGIRALLLGFLAGLFGFAMREALAKKAGFVPSRGC